MRVTQDSNLAQGSLMSDGRLTSAPKESRYAGMMRSRENNSYSVWNPRSLGFHVTFFLALRERLGEGNPSIS